MSAPVVLSRPDRVGDVIITTACIPALRRAFPGAHLILLAQKPLAGLFSGGGSVDRFHALSSEGDTDSLVESFRNVSAQAIFHFHPDERIEKAAETAGIPLRAGFYIETSNPTLTFELPYRKSEGRKHEADYCLELIDEATGQSSGKAERYHLSPDSNAEKTLLEKWSHEAESKPPILINPTTARLDLRWSPEYFDAVARVLAGSGHPIVLVGHPADDPALECLRQSWSRDTFEFMDLSGRLTLPELAHLCRRSALHISRDTGTSHLAAAMGCPQVAIMGRPEGEFSPTRWKPLGEKVEVVATQARRRFYETRRMFWRRSFQSIQPERVIMAAGRLLK